MSVAVVMAARNYARYLPMAVRSVQAQTVADWEMVIIDDGSSDGTAEVVQPFLADRRIRYHFVDRLGQSRAKNLGVRLTRAPLIAFLDADDAWRPNKLERQLEHLAKHPDCGVLACAREIIRPEFADDPAASAASCDTGFSSPARAIHRDEIFIANPICFSSVMIRREVLEHVGGFDPNLDLAIDYDLWLRASRHYAFAALPDKLVLYRAGHANLSQRQAERITTALAIMQRHRCDVSFTARAAGYASTYRSMAWQLRKQSRRWPAILWYARSCAWRTQRLAGLKGILGTLLRA